MKKTVKRLDKSCGSNGGVTRSGQPCGRKTNLDKDGLCKDHGKLKTAKIKADKKKALELLRDPLNTVTEIAEELDLTSWTLFDWRRNDEEFDKEWSDIRAVVDDVRTDIVEGNMFKRATKGNANPAESIFWLKNRASQRWKDKQEKEVYGKDGQALLPIEAVRECLEDLPPEELL
jgi:transposase-like protein